jgi:hypothetical protein
MTTRTITDDDRFHDEATCGACGGPLECWRDAVCETCVPESAFFEQQPDDGDEP